jgi:hypothetical protein
MRAKSRPGSPALPAFEKSKASASFFAKKEAKKLLFVGGCGAGRASARSEQKFFASFFQKRSASFLTANKQRLYQ